MKKVLCLVLVLAMCTTMFAGCKKEEKPNDSSSGNTSVTTEAKKVKWWYYHKGTEGEALEKTIAEYNASQNEYKVEGFSVPDKQKYIVSMSSNESPDLIGLSNQDVITYQANGLLEDLNKMAKDDNFDFTSIYDEQAMYANSVDDVMYGMPFASVIIQMFYNKDLLKEIGETEPPKTMEALYEMAVKATKLDKDGNIDILGYPLFPLASTRQEGIYAFGGRWVDEETGKKVTADSQGVIDSLNMNLKYRNLYGIDKVQKFVATGNTNRYTPQDIFFAGKQLFRFDGPWLAKNIKDNNPDINFGVALIPGTQANPELQGSSRFETTSVAIPVGAKEKEGAFEFAKYISTEGAKNTLLGIGSLPANKNLYDDAELLASNEAFPSFMEALKVGNGVQYPRLADSAKYTSLIEAALDYVYNGTKTPEKALQDLQKEASALK
ncbi:MAG: ABC transporter substrate-binding protein [Oscillospiraceae bacterium]